MGSPGFEPGSTAPKAASIAKLTHDPVSPSIRPRVKTFRSGVRRFAPGPEGLYGDWANPGGMVTTLEVALLLVLLALVLGAYKVVSAVKPFIMNAIVGLLVLLIASTLGANVGLTPLVVLICAVGGVPGAILVLLLAFLDIAFVASLAPLAGLTLA